MKYTQQLLTKNWKTKRTEILRRDKFTCQVCGSKSNLHVHHTHYFKGCKAWEYENIWLVTLCETCHSNEHEVTSIPVEEDNDNHYLDSYKSPMTFKKFKWYLSFREEQPFEINYSKIANWLGIDYNLAQEYSEQAKEEGFLRHTTRSKYFYIDPKHSLFPIQ